MRVTFVLCSYCIVVVLGLVSLVQTKEAHAWTDQSLTTIKTAAALETLVELNFDDVPLRTAVDTLCRAANIELAWDEAAFAEAQISPDDETVALSLQQKISLRSALRLILEPCYLAYEVEGDGKLRITTHQKLNERVVSITYDVQDLLHSEADQADLIDYVQSTASPELWQVKTPSAAGTLQLVDGKLHVTQHRFVHQSIVVLLASLRSQNAAP
jgi:hypothetical protein